MVPAHVDPNGDNIWKQGSPTQNDIDKVKGSCDKVQLGYMCIYVCIMNGMAGNRRLVRT